MSFAVGSLVQVRGREWVVLPESEEDMLMLRPLGGSEEEVTGVYLPLENVEPARFALPTAEKIGDFRSGKLLRDAVRLSFRSSAGPFRSFARIAVEPRPYQLVPLLMALRLDPVRLLIADDVGVGKTIEACLIAREMLDRGEVKRLAILCPPQLAEQWQGELAKKFNISAEVVLPSTASKLERNCMAGQSLFDVYPHVIVSTDFIKADKRRNEFARTCPELVIIDEAHTCALSGTTSGRRHQRYRLLESLAADPKRHILLVSATPHSGKGEAFRSLLELLREDFSQLPADLSNPENRQHFEEARKHIIQRKRHDIKLYMDADTNFPQRKDENEVYELDADYKKLFDRAIKWAREDALDSDSGELVKRVRWWAAIGLLRALSSSPAAAIETLRNRAAVASAQTLEEADETGERITLDIETTDAADTMDITSGSEVDDPSKNDKERRRYRQMARDIEKIMPKQDSKLKAVTTLVKGLLEDGYNPLIFCRFIPTVNYLAEHFKDKFKEVKIAAISGQNPPAEREARIEQLHDEPQRILICTDCLSEGVNLQELFDVVVHYDLSWNPTRHEQREGRVDRFGQPRDLVRVITVYGQDNPIDSFVMNVLLRKHIEIRNSLKTSVSMPLDSNEVVKAAFEELIPKKPIVQQLGMFQENQEDLFSKWDSLAEKEKSLQSLFNQDTIKVEEVRNELEAAQHSIGSGVEVASFFRQALQASGAQISGDNVLEIDLSGTSDALRSFLGNQQKFRARFQMPVKDGVLYLHRTHPLVQGLASYTMDTALDPNSDSVAHRTSVIMTDKVTSKTTLLLVRFRYHLVSKDEQGLEQTMLAEDCKVLGFRGAIERAEWIEQESELLDLLEAAPTSNLDPGMSAHHLSKTLASSEALFERLEKEAEYNGEMLEDAHKRVRKDAKLKHRKTNVKPVLPPDVLGIYVYLPA